MHDLFEDEVSLQLCSWYSVKSQFCRDEVKTEMRTNVRLCPNALGKPEGITLI